MFGTISVNHYPPTIDNPFCLAPAPMKIGLRNVENRNYFNAYRNEHLSKFQRTPYNWGYIESMYMPKPDNKNLNDLAKYFRLPLPKYTMLDSERMTEIDNFYKVAQMHRTAVKDETGQVNPMCYFKPSEYKYQCAPDPTSQYFKFPHSYTKYREPIVYPLTLERTKQAPMLPSRALTGKYAAQSDISYKK